MARILPHRRRFQHPNPQRYVHRTDRNPPFPAPRPPALPRLHLPERGSGPRWPDARQATFDSPRPDPPQRRTPSPSDGGRAQRGARCRRRPSGAAALVRPWADGVARSGLAQSRAWRTRTAAAMSSPCPSFARHRVGGWRRHERPADGSSASMKAQGLTSFARPDAGLMV